MTMREGGFLSAYTDRYWELYNEIGGNHDNATASTFKIRLHMDSEMRKPLTMNLTRDMHSLIDRIEEHKRVEVDQISNFHTMNSDTIHIITNC